MNVFGRDLCFLRRDIHSNIHSALKDPSTGRWHCGCNIEFDPAKLGGNLVARHPSRLPGPQKFCKRCGNHFGKLDRVHRGETVKDV